MEETTGRARDRIFRFSPYLALFEGDDDAPTSPAEVQTTAGGKQLSQQLSL